MKQNVPACFQAAFWEDESGSNITQKVAILQLKIVPTKEEKLK
jgi:hypothetical protein